MSLVTKRHRQGTVSWCWRSWATSHQRLETAEGSPFPATLSLPQPQACKYRTLPTLCPRLCPGPFGPLPHTTLLSSLSLSLCLFHGWKYLSPCLLSLILDLGTLEHLWVTQRKMLLLADLSWEGQRDPEGWGGTVTQTHLEISRLVLF